ncbi:hypothetical protein V8E52_011401 [Russula decolorans]
MKLTNKQGAFVQFLLNGRTLRIPKVTICPTSAITAAGATIYPFLFLSSSFPAAAVAAASQQSRYVLYIMRRRNKLVLLRVSSVTGGSNRQHGHHHSTTSHNHALISHERGRICGGVRTGRCMHLTTRPSLQMEDLFARRKINRKIGMIGSFFVRAMQPRLYSFSSLPFLSLFLPSLFRVPLPWIPIYVHLHVGRALSSVPGSPLTGLPIGVASVRSRSSPAGAHSAVNRNIDTVIAHFPSHAKKRPDSDVRGLVDGLAVWCPERVRMEILQSYFSSLFFLTLYRVPVPWPYR